MLDFTLTEEQNMIRSMVRDFAEKEIAPGYKDRIKARIIPQELVRKMADIGAGRPFPLGWHGYC